MQPDNEKDLNNPTTTTRVKRPAAGESASLIQQQLPRPILPMPALAAREETTISQGSSSSFKAKGVRRSSIASPDRPHLPRPMAGSTTGMVDSSEQTTTATTTTAPVAAKRGRKPGPLSKSAREAQRRLNHSIIEKARRTKINDALTTLKQLVPPDYLEMKRAADDGKDEEGGGGGGGGDSDDSDDCESITLITKAAAASADKQPKPKSKEFKLEILVRTVAFLQDLLKKVNDLEANNIHGAQSSSPVVCQNCCSRKRKRADGDHPHETIDIDIDNDDTDRESTPSRVKVPRTTGDFYRISAQNGMPASSPRVVPSSYATAKHAERLPSISSWLNAPEIDPQLLPAPPLPLPPPPPLVMNLKKPYMSPINTSYLPSPPSSTQFDPVRMTSQAVPPVLNLGPGATGMVGNNNNNNVVVRTSRTPEDETAASMLLHIASSSPSFRPVSAGSSLMLTDPTNFSLHPNFHVVRPSPRARRGEEEEQHQQQQHHRLRQVETPSSILGIRKY